MANYTLYKGDCLEIMPTLEAGSVDAVITDPPYGTTACKWDSIIPFEPMWSGIKHVIKKRAAVVLFGSQPFTSALVMSNADWFKYCWVWDKRLAGNFLSVNRTPLIVTEDIAVFGSQGVTVTYNPQTKQGEPYGESFNIINSSNANRNSAYPTQKTVSLLEYLIKTYTNPGDTVLDFTMGIGTTGVAAMRTGRNFIGIELDEEYHRIAETRIKNAAGRLHGDRERAASGARPPV